MSIKLSEMKKLHDKGFALIYLRPKSKRPFEAKWTSSAKKTWAELENSFDRSSNVGVRLGEPSKLFNGNYLGAIDCDVKSKSRAAITEMNEKLRELGIDLSSAPIVMSGRGNGSKHIYVQTATPLRALKYAQSVKKVKVFMPGDKDRPPSKAELASLTPEEIGQGYRIRAAWEIAFMGTGQQTVLPPSVHPDSGMAYAWASPFMVKHVPLFDASKFSDLVEERKRFRLDNFVFEEEQVDLYSTKIPLDVIQLIESGKGCDDRSSGVYWAAKQMCLWGLTDNQILSVLTDSDHYLSAAGMDRRGNRQGALEWVRDYGLAPARRDTDPVRFFRNKPELKPLSQEKSKALVSSLEEDSKLKLHDRENNGKPRATLRNCITVLENLMSGGLVGLNEFSNRVHFLKDTPYGGIKGREVSDKDELGLKHWLACKYRFEPSKELCYEAHAVIARKYAYHPVRTYLNSLKWDGLPRLDNWLESAFGADAPKQYLTAISRKVLVAGVKRVFEPGCKFDHVLVLEGFQGKGKSMALASLASPEWFTDGLGDIHQKDVVDQMCGKWIIEMAELSSIKKVELESVKAFLSRQVDRVRPPYGRRSEDFPRQSIFVGSTNYSEYLNDETGNRRFWPVTISKIRRRWLRENKDQLWAEAVVRYREGELIYLDKETEAFAKVEQEKRFDVDEWEEEVLKVVGNADGGDKFTITQIWRAFHLADGNAHPPQHESKRVGKILRRLGFRIATHKINKVYTRCWVKI